MSTVDYKHYKRANPALCDKGVEDLDSSDLLNVDTSVE